MRGMRVADALNERKKEMEMKKKLRKMEEDMKLKWEFRSCLVHFFPNQKPEKRKWKALRKCTTLPCAHVVKMCHYAVKVYQFAVRAHCKSAPLCHAHNVKVRHFAMRAHCESASLCRARTL